MMEMNDASRGERGKLRGALSRAALGSTRLIPQLFFTER